MRKVHICSLALLCMAAIAPVSAFAHTGHTGVVHAGGLALGLAHPFSGLDHILVMVAVGIWAVRAGSTARWAAPAMAASGAFVVFHGFVHGIAMDGQGLSYIGGILLATAFLNACGAGAGLMLKRFDRFFLARHAGPVMAAIGVCLYFV